MGPALYLTLIGCAREVVRELKQADNGKETGLDEIIAN